MKMLSNNTASNQGSITQAMNAYPGAIGGGGNGFNPLLNVGAGQVEMRRYPSTDDRTTIIARYEQAENGWIVSIARHEGALMKRYIAATLEDAQKQVAAHIAAERLEG